MLVTYTVTEVSTGCVVVGLVVVAAVVVVVGLVVVDSVVASEVSGTADDVVIWDNV